METGLNRFKQWEFGKKLKGDIPLECHLLRDCKKITFTVLEGKIDSSLDDFFLEVYGVYLLRKNPQDLNRFSPREL